MLLQRLIADDNNFGFNYDYMGYAEFEFGATREARLKLAKLHLDKELTATKARFFERWGRSVNGPVDVFVFGSAKTLKDLTIAPPEGTNVPHDLMLTTDKSSARLDDSKIVGWMSVRTDDPILIVRADSVNFERGDKFIGNFMDGILAKEKEARERLIYTYESGWTQRLVDDLWVLRDGNDAEVDRGKYFFENTEKYRRQTGSLLPTEN